MIIVTANNKKGQDAAMGIKYPILDACCGGRCFWFDKEHPHTLFIDNDPRGKGTCQERPEWNCTPDLIADFTALPFEDGSFYHIVWDPPHVVTMNKNSITTKKYGALSPDAWQDTLKRGFKELWRVLAVNGTLIFKWSEHSKSINDVLRLFPEKPLYGHTTAKSGKTKWFAFFKHDMKEEGVHDETA